MPIDAGSIKWDDAPAIDPKSIKWDEPTPETVGGRLKQQTAVIGDELKNLTLGGVRGAASIGATVMAPIDYLARKAGVDPNGMVGSIVGRDDRREQLTPALQTLGADANSLAFKTGKLGGEIAGTAGAGGMLAQGARGLGAAPELVNALASSGFSVGNGSRLTAAGNLAVRSGAGALAGGVQVGLASPEDAGTGMLFGGALPGVAKVLGVAGNALSGPALSPARSAAVDAARQAGFKLPPTEISPSPLNSLAEGISGKVKTSQAASMRNQPVVNSMAAKALDLPEGTSLTQGVLDGIRADAGKSYQAVSKLPPMNAAGADLPASVGVKSFHDPLTLSPKAEVNPADLVQQWKQANSDASGYFRAYARDANPETLTKAKAAAGDAKKIDSFLDEQLTKSGQGDLLEALKAARVKIAKTYSVEKVLNGETGDISAQGLAKQLQKGKPLSGDLKSIAEFASAFPKAAQTLPQNYNALSPLDFATAAIGGSVGHMAIPLVRPAVRGAILSEPYQAFTASSALRDRLNALAGPAAYRAIPSTGRK